MLILCILGGMVTRSLRQNDKNTFKLKKNV